MKTIAFILCLICASAQAQFQFDSAPFMTVTVPQVSSAIPVDFLVDFEAGTNGNAFTAANFTNSVHAGSPGLFSSLTIISNGTVIPTSVSFFITNYNQPLASNVTISGTVYSGSGSNGLLRNLGAGSLISEYARLSFATNQSKASLGFFANANATATNTSTTSSDQMFFDTVGGWGSDTFVFSTTQFFFESHSGSPTDTHGSMTVTPNKLYWHAMLLDTNTYLTKVGIFDPTNSYRQITPTSQSTFSGTIEDLTIFDSIELSSGTNVPGGSFQYDNIIGALNGNAVFPLMAVEGTWPPQSVSSSLTTTNSITTTWGTNTFATFKVERSQNGGSYSTLASAQSASPYVDSGITLPSSNTYRLTANVGAFPSDSVVGNQIWMETVPTITNIISYWRFDETSGNFYDAVGTGGSNYGALGNTLYPSNTPSYTAGKITNAVLFAKASSQYLLCTNPANLYFAGAPGYTITCWINLNSLPVSSSGVRETICSKYDGNRGYYLWVSDSPVGQLQIYSYNSFVSGATASTFGNLATNTWYFVAAGCDGTNTFISVNAGAQNTGSQSAIGSSTQHFTVGSRNDGSSRDNPFDGYVDCLGVWYGRLSTNQIATLYNSGNGDDWPF